VDFKKLRATIKWFFGETFSRKVSVLVMERVNDKDKAKDKAKDKGNDKAKDNAKERVRDTGKIKEKVSAKDLDTTKDEPKTNSKTSKAQVAKAELIAEVKEDASTAKMEGSEKVRASKKVKTGCESSSSSAPSLHPKKSHGSSRSSSNQFYYDENESIYMTQAVGDLQELPVQTSKTLQMIRRLDNISNSLCRKLDQMSTAYGSGDSKSNKTLAANISSMGKIVEEIAERKIALSLSNYDLIDEHVRILDKQIDVVDKALYRQNCPYPSPLSLSSSARADGHSKSKLHAVDTDEDSNDNCNEAGDKSKKKRNRKESVIDVVEEPVYCLCQRVAFGDMVACDNEDCPIEWFHYPCVGLTKQPKNAWLCPKCRPK
jgi:hypothetical protein